MVDVRNCDFDYSKLRGRIVEKYKTISNFCEEKNVSNAFVSRKLNGINKMTANDVFFFLNDEKLDIPVMEIPLYFFTPKV